MGRTLEGRAAAGGNDYEPCADDNGQTSFPNTPLSPELAKNVSEARSRADKPVREPAAFLFKLSGKGSSNPSKGCVRQLRKNREGSHWSLVIRKDIRSRWSSCKPNDQ